MAINKEVLEGRWNQVKGSIRERWGEVSEQELEQVRGDAEQLVGLIQEKTGEAREQVQTFLENTAERTGSVISRASGAAKHGVEQAAEMVTDVVRSGYAKGENVVVSRPLESLAVCFGVGVITGVVVSLMLRSKS
jgi:uncharacterized protein YjbJ (UPF0337 family)